MHDIKSKTLEELLSLAKEWRDFSLNINGWGRQTYELNDVSIWCYFSEKHGDHAAVALKLAKESRLEAQISFHEQQTSFDINDITRINDLPELIEKCSVTLTLAKLDFATRSETELAEEKKQRIATLEKELTELKGEYQ